MRVTVAAVGRLKAEAERGLAHRYFERAEAAGARIGLSFAQREVSEGRSGSESVRRREEGIALVAALPPQTVLFALDERGKAVSSNDFAQAIGRRRDDGVADIGLVIGGPDGLDPDLVGRAALVVAFGQMTWPHQLVRIMVAEQLYRAVTILSGHPYHRG